MFESTRLEAVRDAAGRKTQGAVGDRSGSAGGRAPVGGGWADLELVEWPPRRRFSAGYKLKVVREADACSRPGEIGALLRREGLCNLLLTEWRRRATRARPRLTDALRRRLGRVEAELETARRVTWVQGNVSALLEELPARGASETNDGQRQR